ncbi:MAG: hypothetical protein LBI67_07605 [Treponema sp.]|nr:hypothetical protein [Treponema sp.]
MLKFKSIIIAFNVVIAFFLAFVFLIPFIVLGRDAAVILWQSSWSFGPALLLLLIGMDLYFALNYRVFLLLEKEDWPALVQELENRVLRKKNYTPRLVKLLANSYLVLSDAVSVNALERKLTVARPALVNANALVFGAARILAQDNRGAVEFFEDRLPGTGTRSPKVSGADREWLSWYHGFALLLNRQFGPAAERFSRFAETSGDGILTGLSSYFIDDTLRKFLPEKTLSLAGKALEGKERVRKALKNRTDWNREVKRLETEVHAVVLTHYIEKAANYVYS